MRERREREREGGGGREREGGGDEKDTEDIDDTCSPQVERISCGQQSLGKKTDTE